MAKEHTFGEKVAARLREFTEDLEAGVPIEATEVRRTETPDGPMHTRRPVVIRAQTKGEA